MADSINPVCILLVEDNPDDIELTQIALEAIPATRIVIVRDGQAALDFLMRKGEFESHDHGSPDFILLDLHLPKVDGIEVLKTIRGSKQLAAMPVVMLSASGRDEDIESAYQHGVNSYVQKPVEFAEFETALGLIRKYWGDFTKRPTRASS